MPPRPIVNDALWRCLCPRYSQLPVSVSLSAPANRATARIGAPRCRAAKPTAHQQLRQYNTSPTGLENPFALPENEFGSASFSKRNTRPTHPRRSLREKVPLVHLPNVELYERLRIDGAAGKYEEVMNIIRILVKDRRERPNALMYTAILHSYTDSEEGTAGKLRKMLDEMESVGIELDGRGAECVLEALAVHPDYLLRTDMLEYMKERWFNLSDRGHNWVVAGMLRDRLFEQALEKLDEMIRNRVKVEGWLWDKTMWMLLEFGEVEEAFYVLSLRQNLETSSVNLSLALWLQLLDAAGEKHLFEAASMVWHNQVVPGYIKPPTGTCLNILSVASRSGDVKLATDVFRVLAERDTVFTTHHYESLIECYLTANDLPAALSVILIMQDSGLKISTDDLHPLYTYLNKQNSRPMEAFALLQDFAAGGKNVPTAAVNACLQASVSLTRLAEAIEIYKALHSVSKSRADTTTFNILFKGCYQAGRKELAMFLANEMIQMDVKPDRLTYDRLILVCLHANDLNDALLYYEEMRGQGWVPRRGTHETLMRKSLEGGDGRVVAVLRDYREVGESSEGRVGMFERMVREKFEERKIEAAADVEGAVQETTNEPSRL